MSDSPYETPVELGATAHLLEQARGGDERARDALCARFLPALRRWAHRRLPGDARALSETDDLVQVTLVRALSRIHEFEPRREGAFLAYLRTILLNVVRDEVRRSRRRPEHLPLLDDDGPTQVSELERLLGRERLAAYEGALAGLDALQREAVILRLEFGYSHAEMRALVAMTKAMDAPDAE